MGVVKYIIQTIKWIPVIFISAVIVWSYYVYVIQLCLFAYLLVFHIIFTLFTWSYIKTIITPPQIPSKQKLLQIKQPVGEYSAHFLDFQLTADQIIHYTDASIEDKSKLLKSLALNLPVNCRNIDGTPRFCVKCKCFKPDRAHHCSTCGNCILKMDHHCPWVNNCVNFSNYKFFVLFLGYALIYCLWIGVTSLQYFIVFWKSMMDKSSVDSKSGSTMQIVFLTLVGFMFSISVLSLLGYHLYLVGRNKSTLEAFQIPTFRNGHKDKRAYDVGCKPNFVQIFGERYLMALLPINTSLGDGELFEVNTATAAYTARCYQSTNDIQTTSNSDVVELSCGLQQKSPPVHPANSKGDGVIFQTRNVEEVGQGLLRQADKDSSDSEH